MNCKEVEKMIPRFLKQELSIKELEVFIEHLDACKNCEEELSIQYLVEEGMVHLEDGNTFDLKTELTNLMEVARKKIRKYHYLQMSLCVFALSIMIGVLCFFLVWVIF